MPTDRYVLSKSYVDAMPYVAGWGHTVQGGAMSSVLHETQLPVLKNKVCLRMYTALLPNISAEQFDEAVLCAGYIVGGKDACKGDSGGPLMIPEVFNNNCSLSALYLLIDLIDISSRFIRALYVIT